jgi:hypothetical protein
MGLNIAKFSILLQSRVIGVKVLGSWKGRSTPVEGSVLLT